MEGNFRRNLLLVAVAHVVLIGAIFLFERFPRKAANPEVMWMDDAGAPAAAAAPSPEEQTPAESPAPTPTPEKPEDTRVMAPSDIVLPSATPAPSAMPTPTETPTPTPE